MTTPVDDRSYFSQPHDDAVAPADLKVSLKEQRLNILWRDGTRSKYALDELRRVCPCATCRTEREQQRSTLLPILSFNPRGVQVVNASLVGNYAIQIEWSDGHKTGIFDFRFLKSMAQ